MGGVLRGAEEPCLQRLAEVELLPGGPAASDGEERPARLARAAHGVVLAGHEPSERRGALHDVVAGVVEPVAGHGGGHELLVADEVAVVVLVELVEPPAGGDAVVVHLAAHLVDEVAGDVGLDEVPHLGHVLRRREKRPGVDSVTERLHVSERVGVVRLCGEGRAEAGAAAVDGVDGLPQRPVRVPVGLRGQRVSDLGPAELVLAGLRRERGQRPPGESDEVAHARPVSHLVHVSHPLPVDGPHSCVRAYCKGSDGLS